MLAGAPLAGNPPSLRLWWAYWPKGLLGPGPPFFCGVSPCGAAVALELTPRFPAEVAVPPLVELQMVMVSLPERMLLQNDARPTPLLQSALAAAGDSCCASACETYFMVTAETDEMLSVELLVGAVCSRKILGSITTMSVN